MTRVINITDIEWVAPPERVPFGGKQSLPRTSSIRQFVAALRLRPNQWAKYPKLTKSGYSTSLIKSMGITDVIFTTRRVKLDDGSIMTETYGINVREDLLPDGEDLVALLAGATPTA